MSRLPWLFTTPHRPGEEASRDIAQQLTDYLNRIFTRAGGEYGGVLDYTVRRSACFHRYWTDLLHQKGYEVDTSQLQRRTMEVFDFLIIPPTVVVQNTLSGHEPGSYTGYDRHMAGYDLGTSHVAVYGEQEYVSIFTILSGSAWKQSWRSRLRLGKAEEKNCAMPALILDERALGKIMALPQATRLICGLAAAQNIALHDYDHDTILASYPSGRLPGYGHRLGSDNGEGDLLFTRSDGQSQPVQVVEFRAGRSHLETFKHIHTAPDPKYGFVRARGPQNIVRFAARFFDAASAAVTETGDESLGHLLCGAFSRSLTPILPFLPRDTGDISLYQLLKACYTAPNCETIAESLATQLSGYHMGVHTRNTVPYNNTPTTMPEITASYAEELERQEFSGLFRRVSRVFGGQRTR